MKPETKVGILFIGSFLLVIVFAYALGVINPFSSGYDLTIGYNFAGGIEVGSPVRVMGIKVGKVKAIEFAPGYKMPNGEAVQLKVKIKVDKQSWSTLKKDSQFFINLAGVIGEKFLEITPGSPESEPLSDGATLRGEDPPRIDQLISQSYGLAGKILQMVEKNEGNVVETIETLNRLVVNFDKLLKQLDRTTQDKEVSRLVSNLVSISSDMAYFTGELRSPEGQQTLALINKLIHRLEPLDAKAIKKFLQEEGIKAKLF